MKVNSIALNIRCFEYRQDPCDEDYGSCVWARFYFNLDRYEIMIVSDCGNYGYKWVETPKSESFMQLMARCDGGYLLDKIYGRADIFDYEATKKSWLDSYSNNETEADFYKSLREFFDDIELDGIPETAEAFVERMSEFDYGLFGDQYDIWNSVEYAYPGDAKKIAEVFETAIVPAIKRELAEYNLSRK